MTNVVGNDKAAIFAEEAFVVDVQSFLHTLMEEKGLSRAQLAQAMGVSRARVTQLFSDSANNFTVRLLAKAAYAMGEKIELDCSYLQEMKKREAVIRQTASASRSSNVVPIWSRANDFDDADILSCHVDDRLASYVNMSTGLFKDAA